MGSQLNVADVSENTTATARILPVDSQMELGIRRTLEVHSIWYRGRIADFPSGIRQKENLISQLTHRREVGCVNRVFCEEKPMGWRGAPSAFLSGKLERRGI